MNNDMSRREFLKTSITGAGLAIAVVYTPYGCTIVKFPESIEEVPKSFSPNAWLEITPDNRVTIVVSQSEMGQGVYTSLPMIVAEELEADWRNVHFVAAPAADVYRNRIQMNMQFTGGSTSVRHRFDQLRKAGAAAREMLLLAASAMWAVPKSECEASEGVVRHKQSHRRLTYGELCLEAAKMPLPQAPPLKDETRFRLIGQPLPRLDVPDKVNGTARFGMDVLLPDVCYAVLARPPRYGAKILSYDPEAAKKMEGLLGVVRVNRGVAVCAETLDGAWKGREALGIRWDAGSHPQLDNDALDREFNRHLDKKGATAKFSWGVKRALSQAEKKVEATYVLPYLAHCTMEPMNCTARVEKDRCDVWVPTQFQTGAQQVAAAEAGLRKNQVHIHTTYLGCGFGRRMETDVVEEAVQIAKAVDRPVRVVWTREEDMRHDYYRPANACRIEGGLDQKGNVVAWRHRVVAPSIFSRLFPRWVRKGVDPAAVEGLVDTDYEIPNFHVEYVKMNLPIPVGFWRSVGHSHNAFTVECFMDELAHAAGRDPVEFRLSLLEGHPRPRRVLEVVAEKAGWGRPLEHGQGRGIARHSSFESHAAHVVEVSVDQGSGEVKVHRVVCAIDCGPVINPDTVKAQMEGAAVMGLSAALKERVLFSNGGATSSNFDDYQILRMEEIPDIEVYLVKSQDKIGGIGEPGLPSVAPALANAIFHATGVRVRRLPVQIEAT